MPTSPLKTKYRDDLILFRDRWEFVGLALAIFTIIAFPFLANDHWLSLGVDVWIMIVGAVSMMVLTGFAGQVSLGHAAFLAVGAYATAICSLSFGMPFWLALPIGMVLCTIVGVITGPFALRLEGLYLAIVTIGLLFLVQHLLRNGLDIYYGKDYLHVPFNLVFVEAGSDPLGDLRHPYEIGPWILKPTQILYFVVAPISLVCIWVCRNIQRSNTGRAMMAVRDGELAAGALGVDAARTKILAFGISSAFAGLAGGLYALAHPVVTLEPFNLHMSVEFIAIVVLGGVGTTFGAVSGAIAFLLLHPLASQLGGFLPFPEAFSSEHRAALLFYPVLCLFLVIEPFGLYGLWLRVKRYFLAWPFSY